MNKSFVYYRLPNGHQFVALESTHRPQAIFATEELLSKKGFVLAPFAPTRQTPILLLQPDSIRISPIPEQETGCDESLDISPFAIPERESYGKAFREVHRNIKEGICKKVVLSHTISIPINKTSLSSPTDLCSLEQIFFNACHLYPNCFICLISMPESGTWISATPELLLRKTGEDWKTMALAGTKEVRNEHPSLEDFTEKEQTEHQMVVDFVEEVLQKEGFPHSIRPKSVRSMGAMEHLCTEYTLSLKETKSWTRLLNRLHPTPAVCGVPSTEARRIIEQVEKIPRTYYSGYFGPLRLLGETAFFVHLRCMEVGENEIRLHAGGGLTLESTEEEEWREILKKMNAIIQIC